MIRSILKKRLKPNICPRTCTENLIYWQKRLSAVSDFNVKTAEEAFRGVVAQLGIEAGVLVHPVRVALTGKAVGPGLV